MALASLSDYVSRHGDVPTARQAIVEELLGDASELVLDEVDGSGASWIDADVTADDNDIEVPRLIVAICVAATHRAFTNPSALAAKALGQKSYTYQRRDFEDALYLTDREKRRLTNSVARSSFRSATLATPYSGDSADGLPDLPL